MNRRKPSTDRGSKQKTASRRPSTTSLHTKQNVSLQKVPKPEKLSSTHNILDDNTIKMVNKAVDVCGPKTRFNSDDRSRDIRSCSSPRLKYFPAEKVKKLDSPPPFSPKPIGALIAQQDPRESGVFYVAGHPEQRCDNGQGDAAAVTQHLQQSRHQHGMHAASQQQVPAQQTISQVGQMNPHSECTLQQQGPNLQTHRPFVPRDYPPQKNAQANFSNPPQVPANLQAVVRQIPNADREIALKTEDPPKRAEDTYEKQPIGGRNAALYRRAMSAKLQGQPQAQIPMDPATTNQANVDPQQTYDQYGLPSNVRLYRNPQNPQNPQQAYQQLRQNFSQQQQMQQRAMNYQMQMLSNQRSMGAGQPQHHSLNSQLVNGHFSAQGMTSPQDATVNRMRNSRMTTPDHYSMNHPNGWTRNNHVTENSNGKAQLGSYSVDVANGNQSLYRMQNQQQQFVPQYQQQHQHQQQQFLPQYQQQQQFVPRYQQQPVHQPQQLYRNPVPGNMTMQRQQIVTPYNQLAFHQQTIPNQQCDSQQPVDGNPEIQTAQKKSLKFTTGMIRDQEKLLATMKQQGVPMDVTMRQFETLLNEQRRHLEYLEQIRQQDRSPERRRPMSVPCKRRQEDEKPEWMIHLTPTRVSYIEREKLQEKRKKEREVQKMEQLQLQQQQRMIEMAGQQAPPQVVNEQNYQTWQQPNWLHQPRAPQQYRNVSNLPYVVPGAGNGNEPLTQMNYQQSVPRYHYAQQLPYQQPVQQHHQQLYNPQQYQQFYQAIPRQNQEQVHPPSQHRSFPVDEGGRPTTEPSSLLKMRLYKKEIRPQRQNNGLQDPGIAKKHLEELRLSAEARKGLEYLVNFAPKKPAVKLNGIQDRTDAEAEFQHRFVTSSYQPPPKRLSANGLENSRNPNNPPNRGATNPTMRELQFLKEYPRQKEDDPRYGYPVQAERENGSVAMVQQQLPRPATAGTIAYNDKGPTMVRGNALPFRFDESYPQHYRQMQRYYRNTKNFVGNIGDGDVVSAQGLEQNKVNPNRAGGDINDDTNGGMNAQTIESGIPYHRVYYSQPNINEARTIGGVRYLARKQDYLPNQQIVSPETLITSRHLQPPIVC